MAISAKTFFELADTLPFADVSAIVGDGGVLVVSPHPDDESLGCGGLLAFCHRDGRAAHVAMISDGAGSHPNSKAYPYDDLRDLRERETREALAALGFTEGDITFFRLPDRFVPHAGSDADSAVDRLVDLARKIDASAILVTWRHDPHADHKASFAIAREAATRLGAIRFVEYPVWGHTLPVHERLDGFPKGTRLDIAAVLDAKRAAIAAHRSQVTDMIDDDPHAFQLAPEMIARFERPFEIYLFETAPEEP